MNVWVVDTYVDHIDDVNVLIHKMQMHDIKVLSKYKFTNMSYYLVAECKEDALKAFKDSRIRSYRPDEIIALNEF